MVANNAKRHKRQKAHDNENNALGGQFMSGTRPLRLSAALLAGALALAGAATGQDAAAGAGQEAAAESPAIGPVTHLPLPRFVSLKA
ncbi:MAG: hypothetical protein D6801_01625, partial [Alphaproteobacteria bacterium]